MPENDNHFRGLNNRLSNRSKRSGLTNNVIVSSKHNLTTVIAPFISQFTRTRVSRDKLNLRLTIILRTKTMIIRSVRSNLTPATLLRSHSGSSSTTEQADSADNTHHENRGEHKNRMRVFHTDRKTNHTY